MLRLGCRAAPRSPDEPATAILHSSKQRPFQSAPLSRRGGSGPHLHRGLNRVKSQSSQTGVRREEGGMKNKTEERRIRGQGDALRSGIPPVPPP